MFKSKFYTTTIHQEWLACNSPDICRGPCAISSQAPVSSKKSLSAFATWGVPLGWSIKSWNFLCCKRTSMPTKQNEHSLCLFPSATLDAHSLAFSILNKAEGNQLSPSSIPTSDDASGVHWSLHRISFTLEITLQAQEPSPSCLPLSCQAAPESPVVSRPLALLVVVKCDILVQQR